MTTIPSNDFMIIALPKTKGAHRVGTHLADVLSMSGITEVEPPKPRQDDVWYSFGPDIRFKGVQASSSDCADYLLEDVVDAAVIGLNRLADKILEADTDPKLVTCLPLSMPETECNVVFAKAANDTSDGRSYERVLASHPNIARAYFESEGIEVGRIIPKDGSLETAGRSLYGHCPIVDITQTGNSLRANGYEVVDTIMKSEAVLAWKPTCFDHMSTIDCFAQQMGLSISNRQSPKTLPILAHR